MSHVITTIVVVFATMPMLAGPLAALIADRSKMRHAARGAAGLAVTYAVGFGVSAFWSLALGVRVFGGMTSDMGWAPVTNIIGDTNPGSPLPGEFIPVVAVGVIGMLWTLFRKDGIGMGDHSTHRLFLNLSANDGSAQLSPQTVDRYFQLMK